MMKIDDGNDDDNDETVKAGSERDEDDDDNNDEEELAKNDDEDTESGKGSDEVSESKGESDEEETRQEEEESFDLIPRTPKGSEDEGNDEEDQDLRLSEKARIQKNSHVTLTLVHPDGLQESSSVSSFVTSMLNPISDAGVESIFTMKSSPIVSLQTPTPIMTPSTIATITTSSDAPIPPTTIPSIILENLPTFNSAFRFDERLRSLETTFSEYRQTNPFVDTVSTIPGIVHQYITQQMTEVKENQEKDKIGSKPDKNGKRGEARKSLKKLQLKEEEKLKKTKKEWPKTRTRIKSYLTLKKRRKEKGHICNSSKVSTTGANPDNFSNLCTQGRAMQYDM
nr:hypothetical protein [Tanacetum cinerariifolium]